MSNDYEKLPEKTSYNVAFTPQTKNQRSIANLRLAPKRWWSRRDTS